MPNRRENIAPTNYIYIYIKAWCGVQNISLIFGNNELFLLFYDSKLPFFQNLTCVTVVFYLCDVAGLGVLVPTSAVTSARDVSSRTAASAGERTGSAITIVSSRFSCFWGGLCFFGGRSCFRGFILILLFFVFQIWADRAVNVLVLPCLVRYVYDLFMNLFLVHPYYTDMVRIT